MTFVCCCAESFCQRMIFIKVTSTECLNWWKFAHTDLSFPDPSGVILMLTIQLSTSLFRPLLYLCVNEFMFLQRWWQLVMRKAKLAEEMKQFTQTEMLCWKISDGYIDNLSHICRIEINTLRPSFKAKQMCMLVILTPSNAIALPQEKYSFWSAPLMHFVSHPILAW